MFHLRNVLELVIGGLYKHPSSEQNHVIKFHKRIIHVLFGSCDKVYVGSEGFFKSSLLM